MNIPYMDSIFIGMIRLFLWILFMYVMKRLLFKGQGSKNQVNSMANMWAIFASLVMLLIFLLVQINSYDLMTCIAILVLFFALRLVGIRNLWADSKLFKRQRTMILLRVLENIEDKEPIIDVVEEKPSKRLSVNFEFIVMVIPAVLALLVRFYLLNFDDYQLSSAWFQELSIVKSFSKQVWFGSDPIMVGEYALLNFYGIITGISPEIALESFGILQSFILTFVVFWFMNVMTSSKITVPLITALLFALFFNLAPVNLSQITHSKQTLMALTFALPLFVFVKKPWMLYRGRPKTYLPRILIVFVGIAMTNLFTLLILIPPFLVIAFVFVEKRYLKHFLEALLAFAVITGIVFGLYAIVCYQNGLDFSVFLASNLLSVSASTSTSNMSFSYDLLLKAVQWFSLGAIILMFFMLKKMKDKWAGLVSFLIYVNALLLITYLDFNYFDKDLFNEVLPVYIAISVGIMVYLIMYFFENHVTTIKLPMPYAVLLILIIMLPLSFFSQKKLFNRTNRTSTIPKEVMKAYQKITSDFLPYSYAVINSNTLQPISDNSHNFITYRDFVNTYSERDSIYFANKQDKVFLRENTRFILPNSLLLFVYSGVETLEFNGLVISNDLRANVSLQLELLRSRGREIKEFYISEHLLVYEIVNNPGQARIEEML